MSADHIAIGTRVYNYNVPAVLKAYIDHIVRIAGGNAKSVDMGQTTRDAFLQTFASDVAEAAARN